MLLHQLITQLKLTRLARVFHAPVDVVFDEKNVVEPDLVIVASANSSIIVERAVEGAPDVVVEVLSPSSIARDRKLKLHLYARFGVREYWIVDPVKATLEAHRLAGDAYQLREFYDRRATLRCPDFPSLAVDLSVVFDPA